MNYHVYILTNQNRTTLYIGVTNNLQRRIYEHKQGVHLGFTKKYNLHQLVYFEHHTDIKAAIGREKQLKGGSRKKKLDLINSLNPSWQDLYETL